MTGRGRDRAQRTYRALPEAAQVALVTPVNLVRALTHTYTTAPPTLALPMHDQVLGMERTVVGSLLAVLTSNELPFVFIPAPEPSNIRLAVPVERRSDLLVALARGSEDLAVSWPGPRRFHSVPVQAAGRVQRDHPDQVWIHRRQRAVNVADARDALRAVAVEFWAPGERGTHEAVLSNSYASTIRFDAPTRSKQARTGHDLPTVEAFLSTDIGEVTFPVDAVYLWVDDADRAWRGRRDHVLRALGVQTGHESADEARFRQHDELRYSLRSLSQFAPWIRHVYLVTDQQVPDWLDRDCPRISVVDHGELFDGVGRLPTFNSHALAARLHHIPGIADHFLYLNDDFFLGRRTGAELWFDGNGQPRCYFTRTTSEAADVSDESPLSAARNHTFDLVEQLTGRLRRRNLQHGPYAIAKQVMFALEQQLPEEFERTWSSQLRSGTDFVPERLHSQVGHAWGRAIDSRGVRYKYFNVGQPEAQGQMRAQLDSRWADTFCLNDAEGPVPAEQRGRAIRDFLGQYFPTPSEFELPGR
ncbi:MAG: stealth conserved region 3 domain-containing protein [Candidatus Nanopelagicales bacterium]